MLAIPGFESKDTCDGVTRRDLMRVGGSAVFGLSLANLFALQGSAKANKEAVTSEGKGFGKAKSVILIYLQGGPSHLDLWDPKEDVPASNKSVFKNIPTKIPGTQFTELLPKLSQVVDKTTLIRTMSYTPNGLFNHTAAIYQMHTGYTTDKVSASGQLEPPNAKIHFAYLNQSDSYDGSTYKCRIKNIWLGVEYGGSYARLNISQGLLYFKSH